MSGKSKASASLAPYRIEDIDRSAYAVEESAADRFIDDHRDELNAALQQAYDSLERGDGVAYDSLDELHRDIAGSPREKS